MEWIIKTYKELTINELYQLLKLRQEVFVVEQNCAYLDADNKDIDAIHLLGFDNEVLIAYARIVLPGIKYVEPSIGRVLVSAEARKYGIGSELMNRAIMVSKKLFPSFKNRISAQAHLQKFYENVGFTKVSDVYDEDGIPHIEMLLN
ncbi:MAG: GNAT family N-acetyltransferase [Cytophagales bacterium]